MKGEPEQLLPLVIMAMTVRMIIFVLNSKLRRFCQPVFSTCNVIDVFLLFMFVYSQTHLNQEGSEM